MPDQSNKHAYGWIRDLPDQRDIPYRHDFEAARLGLTSLPPSVDLRPQMPPIYDQGQLGSCTANSISAGVQFLRKKEGLTPDFEPSRLGIYYNERKDDGDISQDGGSSIRESCKAVAKYGVFPETEWPYDVTKYRLKPPTQSTHEALQHKVTSYLSVQQSASAMKICLASGYPIHVGFTVYESFESQQVEQTGIAPLPAAHESVLGGHAVMVVGYDDAAGTWLCRNSWGVGWGLAGYLTFPYAYLTNPKLSSDFWTLRVAA